MDELKKLLEGVFASVNAKGAEALIKTEGFDALEESQKTELQDVIAGVQTNLTESLQDQLTVKLTEYVEKLEDDRAAEVADLKEKAEQYGETLIEKGEQYGAYLIENAEAWCNEQLEQKEAEISEKLDDYLEIAFAEKLGESRELANSQKALAYEYMAEQLKFVMEQVGLKVAEDDGTGAIAEAQEKASQLTEATAELDTLRAELASFKRRDGVIAQAVDAGLSEAQCEKLQTLAEHLSPDDERFESRVKYLVGFIKEGNTDKIDESVAEEFTPDPEKSKTVDPAKARMTSYLTAAKMTSRRF